MVQHKAGSSLLMVLCFTGALSLMVVSILRNTLYGLEAALARVEYVKSLKSTEGLLNLAIEVGIENYKKIMERTQETTIEFPAWFSHHGLQYRGAIIFKPQKDLLLVSASLKDSDKTWRSIRCFISKEAQEKYKIRDWAIEERV